MKKLINLLRKPPRVWFFALKSLFLSGYFRWKILHRPFAELSPKIGTFGGETSFEAQDEQLIRDVQFAVVGICNRTPWESKCLVQALTAKKLLNRYKLPCTLYMGVAKDREGSMIAHAWLRCGMIFVTGGRGHLYYTVTGQYADPES